MKVEWDNTKAAANEKKHGVSFQNAAEAMRDPGVVEKLDLRENYGEERIVALAMLNGQILVVVYTERKDIIRIISARRANKHEQQNYYSQIGT